MRRVAGASLLALVGCNQIFGITPTQEYDATTDVIPDRPHVVLDWQIATVLPSGAPDPVIRFAPIDPAPKVRIAPLDGPFDRDQATYAPGDGSIQIPAEYLNTTWRLEYILVGDVVPHEVQWTPEDKQGHLTVPVFGRLQRDPVPVGSGYTITPGGPSAVTSYSHPRVLTTGMWSEGCVVGNCTMSNGGKIDYDFYSNATYLIGARGRPEPTLGDRALLVDYVDGNSMEGSVGCRIAAGSATLASAALEPGMHTVQTPTPTWDSGRRDVMGAAVDLRFVARLAGLGKLQDSFLPLSPQLFGFAASTDMPGLAGGLREGLLPVVPMPPPMSPLPLPLPVMQTLVQCPYNKTLPRTAQPMLLDSFARIQHVQLVDTRKVLGVDLNSGMETVIAAAAAGGFTMAFPAAIPMQFTLATPMNGTVDLAGDSDQVAVGPTSGPFELSFTPEIAAELRADYYDVVLHRIAAGALTTDRIYTVTAPKVRIDGSMIVPGADYVFEVRSYKGHPQAQHGDFAPVDYPYGSAIVFTRTFKAS